MPDLVNIPHIITREFSLVSMTTDVSHGFTHISNSKAFCMTRSLVIRLIFFQTFVNCKGR